MHALPDCTNNALVLRDEGQLTEVRVGGYVGPHVPVSHGTGESQIPVHAVNSGAFDWLSSLVAAPVPCDCTAQTLDYGAHIIYTAHITQYVC